MMAARFQDFLPAHLFQSALLMSSHVMDLMEFSETCVEFLRSLFSSNSQRFQRKANGYKQHSPSNLATSAVTKPKQLQKRLPAPKPRPQLRERFFFRLLLEEP
jgi:hypothetical protein